MKIELPGGQIELMQGDITEVKADALVNNATSQMYMNAGVAGAMKRKGGLIIEGEALKQAPVDIGKSITTSPGTLPAKYIIHAAVMGITFQTNEESIKQGVISVLKEANRLKLKSIAFPALGTGLAGFPFSDCAKIMIETIKNMLPSISIDHVIIVLFSNDAFLSFKHKAKELTS